MKNIKNLKKEIKNNKNEEKRIIWHRVEFCANCGTEFEYESESFCACPFCGNDYDIHTIESWRVNQSLNGGLAPLNHRLQESSCLIVDKKEINTNLQQVGI